MSWSINLFAPKEVAKLELADALLVIDRALDWVENAEDDSSLSVNVGGYVSWTEEGITKSNVNFSVTESAPSKPQEPTVENPAHESCT